MSDELLEMLGLLLKALQNRNDDDICDVYLADAEKSLIRLGVFAARRAEMLAELRKQLEEEEEK